MTTDREQLEFAAKAAGYALRWNDNGVDCWSDNRAPGYWAYWNPGTDDGDEARLEAALMLDVRWWRDFVLVINRDGTAEALEYYADHNGDRQAARRAAGVRCAAEIGRRM